MKKRFCPFIVLLLTLVPVLSMATEQEQQQLSREEQDARAFEAMFPRGKPSETDLYRADMVDGFTQPLSNTNSNDTKLYRAELGFDNCSPINESGVTANLNVQSTHTDTFAQLFPNNAVMPIGVDGNIDFVSPTGMTFFPDGVIGQPRTQTYRATPELARKLMYGRAFRAPSLNELYVHNNPSNNGNHDLEPETIDTYELAFTWEPTERFTLGTNFFYYDINGLLL